MGAATQAPPRDKLDDDALEQELEESRGPDGDDGLGAPTDPPSEEAPAGERPEEVTEEEFNDPNSEYNSGVPGGRKPGDDGYVEPPIPGQTTVDDQISDGGQPPTPPADLPGGEEEPEDEDEDQEPVLALAGDRELGLKVGGKKPDSCTLSLKGGKIDLQGQFDRGDRFLTVTTLQVTGDNDQDTIVKHTGEVTSSSKKQGATVCGVSRIEPWLLERLKDGEFDDESVAAVFKALDLKVPEEA